MFSNQTQGGRSVKLKCSSAKEAEDWKEALEAESAAPLEGSLGLEESSATEVSLLLTHLDVWGMITERIYRICAKNWFLNVYHKSLTQRQTACDLRSKPIDPQGHKYPNLKYKDCVLW